MGTKQIVMLEEVCEVIAGQSPPSNTYNLEQEGLPFFQGKADFGEIFPVNRMWCEKPIKIAQPGDILLSVRAPVGPTNLCKENCCIGRGLSAIRPGKDADTKYILYFFRSIEKKLSEQGRGSTFSAITQSEIRKIKIPLPPLPEQKRIAAILDKADAVRRKRQETIRLLDEFLRSVFLEMFGDPVRNEKGWEKSKIGELTKVETGSTPSRDIKEYYDNGNIPWVKTSEVQNNYIVKCEEYITEQALKETNCKVLPEDTILIAMYGQGQTRGRVGYMKINGATNQACAAILPSELINSLFLYYQLRFRYLEIRNMGRGGNQPNLNLSMIKDFMILYPPITLQEKFAQIAEKVTKQQALFYKSLVKIENGFNSLMQNAFRGEL